MATKVSFKNEDGHVLVVFPDQRERNGMIGVLSRAEGHSTADAGYIRGLKAATAEQRAAGERLLRDAGYAEFSAKRNPDRHGRLTEAEIDANLAAVEARDAARRREEDALVTAEGRFLKQFPGRSSSTASARRMITQMARGLLRGKKSNPLLANPAKVWPFAVIAGPGMTSSREQHAASVHATREAALHRAASDTRAFRASMKPHGGSSGRYVAVEWGRPKSGTWWPDMRPREILRNPLLANPTYRAVLDSDASPRSVKKMLAAAGFAGARVRTVKGTGKKKAPGAYAQFVKKHMADFKGRMIAPEAMKAIGALWRSRGGAKSNPLLTNPAKARGPWKSMAEIRAAAREAGSPFFTKRKGSMVRGESIKGPYQGRFIVVVNETQLSNGWSKSAAVYRVTDDGKFRHVETLWGGSSWGNAIDMAKSLQA